MSENILTLRMCESRQIARKRIQNNCVADENQEAKRCAAENNCPARTIAISITLGV